MGQELIELVRQLVRGQEELRRELAEMKKLFSSSAIREAYTIEQVAKRLGRSQWTVRQWCNNGQVPDAQKIHGRGRRGEWRIPHDVLLRLESEGPAKSVNQKAA